MTCSEAFDEILEADREILQGRGDTPLARHIRECVRCGGLARSILTGEAALGRELSGAVPAPDLELLLDQAAALHPVRRRPRHLQRRTLGFTLIPLAAAATLVSLFLNTEPSLPGNPVPVTQSAPGLGLDFPEGRNVAVLATDNPDITVLWFF